MDRATKEEKSFNLTFQARMIQPAIDVYVKSILDSVVTNTTDFVESKSTGCCTCKRSWAQCRVTSW